MTTKVVIEYSNGVVTTIPSPENAIVQGIRIEQGSSTTQFIDVPEKWETTR